MINILKKVLRDLVTKGGDSYFLVLIVAIEVVLATLHIGIGI